MIRYSQHKATQYDVHITQNTYEDWYVLPVTRNRDSHAWERANFDAAMTILEGETEGLVEILRFGHWACGWYEIIVVNPKSAAVALAERIEKRLEDYPILDEELWSQYEQEDADLAWMNCYTPAQRVEFIRKHRSEFSFHDLADMVACVRGKFYCGDVCRMLEG